MRTTPRPTSVRTRLGLLTAAAAVGVGSLLAPAPTAVAAPASGEPEVTAQSVVYIPGKSRTTPDDHCKVWLNRRTSDNYVQAVGQSWQHHCIFYLERVDTTLLHTKPASGLYHIQVSKKATGFHWNGKGVGARGCILDSTIGQSVYYCGEVAW